MDADHYSSDFQGQGPGGLESVKRVDEWTAEPNHWSTAERGLEIGQWISNVIAQTRPSYLIMCLFNALQNCHSRVSTPVRIWLLPSICAMLEIWIAVNTAFKLYHQARPFKCISYGDDAALFLIKKFGFNQLFFKLCSKGTSKYSLALVFFKPRWAMGRSLIRACVCGRVFYMRMSVTERFSLHHYPLHSLKLIRGWWEKCGLFVDVLYTCAHVLLYLCSRWL